MVNDLQLSKITKLIASHTYVKKIILFGSYAKKTMTKDSDLDIMVIVDDSISHPRSLMANLYQEILPYLTVPCDLLVEHEAKFHKRSKYPTIERTISNEGRIMYVP